MNPVVKVGESWKKRYHNLNYTYIHQMFCVASPKKAQIGLQSQKVKQVKQEGIFPKVRLIKKPRVNFGKNAILLHQLHLFDGRHCQQSLPRGEVRFVHYWWVDGLRCLLVESLKSPKIG